MFEKKNIKNLTTKQVEENLKKYGLNKLPEAKEEAVVITFLKQFCDPLIYILLFGAILSFVLKEFSDGIFILIILAVNSIIGAGQEISAHKSASSLKNMVKSRVVVVRDDEEIEIDSEFLVPDDFVILKDGTKVPADIVLTESINLEVNESMLTGESLAVKKDANYIQQENCLIQEKFNELFAGTIIVKGFAKGIVKSTGLNTEMGKIADKITGNSEAETPLVARMQRFSKVFTIIIGIATLIIVIASVMRGDSLQETLLMAISLAVASIPEGLPITITIALAIGMLKMSKRNVIVRNLSAVESLGSCTVIASDKTGTLTKNEMTAEIIIDNNGKDISNDFAKQININNLEDFKTQILLAMTLPNEAGKNHNGFFGDAVDVAFLRFVEKNNCDVNEIKNNFEQLKILFYTSEAKCSASFNKIDNKIWAFVKGAPETVLSYCKESDYKLVLEELEKLTTLGYRVLAVACGEIEINEEYSYHNLKNLNFLCLTAMLDPLKDTVKESIKICQEAGIKIVMITGDNPKTAFTIANQLNFVQTQDEVKTGVDVRTALNQGEQVLDELTLKTKVYSRMEPTQKLDIVQSLIRNGNFVAVTGDGVNDAPALKNANVGVSMGKGGTDIARESSDIVLMDDNFSSITHAVEEGRIVYNNIRKVIFFAVSCGIPKVIIFLLAIFAGLPTPFTATQLLWLNVMTEGVQNIFLAFERSEGDEMKKNPRPPEEDIFNSIMVKRSIISIIFITFICMIVYYYTTRFLLFSHIKSSSILLMLFVFLQNMQVLNARSETKSVFKHSFKKNKKILVGIACAVGIHVLASYVPFMQKLLRVESLSFKELAIAFIIASSLILVSEIEKLIRNKQGK